MSRVAAALVVEVNRRVAGVVSSGDWLRSRSLRLKRLSDAQASTSVPYTVKCSSESNCMVRACTTTRVKNSLATSCSKAAPGCARRSMVEARLDRIHIEEPAEQEIVVELLAQIRSLRTV